MVLKLVKGTVKWFNSRKGYGFISSEEGNDVFVHFSSLAGDSDEYKMLNENDNVEFEIVIWIVERKLTFIELKNYY